MEDALNTTLQQAYLFCLTWKGSLTYLLVEQRPPNLDWPCTEERAGSTGEVFLEANVRQVLKDETDLWIWMGWAEGDGGSMSMRWDVLGQ